MSSKPPTATLVSQLGVDGTPKPDLWEQALSNLNDEDRKQFDVSSASPHKVLQEVQKATEDTRKECVAKGWRVYRKKNGEEVKLRHVLEKLSVWIDEAIKVVDLGISFDQSGHAALPWAAVKFIVTMGKSNIEVFSNVVEGVESLSGLIARYAIVEKLYLHGTSDATDGLRKSIKELYANILIYLARARSYFSGNTSRQIGRGLIEAARKQYDLTKISDTEVRNWMKLADREFNRETAIVEIKNHGMLERALRGLSKPITQMTVQLKNLHDNFDREERKEVFRWMSEIEYRNHHEDLSKDLLPNSGQWLLDSEPFVDWGQSSVSSILWLHGIPGSGKTRLISRVIDLMIREEGFSAKNPPAFFYCARSTAEPERGKPVEILGAILRQLCSSKPDEPIREPVATTYRVRKEKADNDCSTIRKLSVEDCTRLILELTENVPVTIIVDALDECDEVTRHELLEAFDIIISKSTEVVKVLVSSRDDIDIKMHLENCKNISISAYHNGGDIARFVVSEVDRLTSKKLLLQGKISERLRRDIIETLISGAQGMFRWVAMSLERLQRIKYKVDFEKALGQLPNKLSELYDIIYSQIDHTETHGRDVATKTFKWLLCAQRLLNVWELAAAVELKSEDKADSAVDSDEEHSESSKTVSLSKFTRFDDIIQLCRNLVVIDPEQNVFRFAHQSVREYLLSREEYSEENQHVAATERCIDVYLAEAWPESANAETVRQNSILKPYATLYWPVHLKYAELSVSQGFKTKVKRFMTHESTTSPAFTKWTEMLLLYFWNRKHGRIKKEYGRQARLAERLPYALVEPHTHLVIICAFGLSFLLEEYKLSPFECNRNFGMGSYFAPGYYRTPGLYFTRGFRSTLLTVASLEGHARVLQILIGKGAEVNARGTFDCNALQAASRNGHYSIVQLLLDKGAEVNVRDGGYGSALQEASRQGHASVVQMLLNAGADINAQGGKYGSSLEVASRQGHISVVQLLLDNGANVNGHGNGYGSALEAASERGHVPVVQLLLDNGADVNARGKMNGSALLAASRFRHASVVQLLLDKGADVNERNYGGRSALHVLFRAPFGRGESELQNTTHAAPTWG